MVLIHTKFGHHRICKTEEKHCGRYSIKKIYSSSKLEKDMIFLHKIWKNSLSSDIRRCNVT
jgi:hypothetical protein